MKSIIVVTGASSGFGLMAAQALAKAGHTVYASMREITSRNAPQAAAVKKYSAEHGVDLRPIELDVSSEPSVEAAIGKIIAENGRLDVVVHNAGHMVFGPAEAFTPEQPFGKRPFRVHIDPSQDGAEIVNGVADRVRAELLRRIGLEDILRPTTAAS
jgi:NAD(P)-dependent dehydrogenase (short-subunit alcohol dehydrogenase family)